MGNPIERARATRDLASTASLVLAAAARDHPGPVVRSALATSVRTARAAFDLDDAIRQGIADLDDKVDAALQAAQQALEETRTLLLEDAPERYASLPVGTTQG